MLKHKILIFFVIFVFFGSCSKDPIKKSIIEIDKMIKFNKLNVGDIFTTGYKKKNK